MAESRFFTEIRIPQQKTYNNAVLFPTILSPKPNKVPINLSLLVQEIRVHKPWLDSFLHKTGAILFRGFLITTASHFNDVVESFGYDEQPYKGGVAPRIHVIGRVFTANEAPPEQNIHFHHEMSHATISNNHIIYERMKEKYPKFVERLEKHGLIYTRVLGEDDDTLWFLGRGWKSTFSTKDKSVAEERAAKLNTKLEWMEDGLVKTVMGPLPGVKVDESRQRNIWFNGMVVAYEGWKNARNDPVKMVTFGDGQPLPSDIVHNCLKILDEESLAIPWQKGDVFLLDNMVVLHSRGSFHPPRRILASLCK